MHNFTVDVSMERKFGNFSLSQLQSVITLFHFLLKRTFCLFASNDQFTEFTCVFLCDMKFLSKLQVNELYKPFFATSESRIARTKNHNRQIWILKSYQFLNNVILKYSSYWKLIKNTYKKSSKDQRITKNPQNPN